MLSFTFTKTVPGIRLLAFCTPAVELGSAMYCQWFIWRLERLFTWVMSASNCVMVSGASVCLYHGSPRTPLHYFLWAIGVGLAVGRQYCLWCEMSAWHSAT